MKSLILASGQCARATAAGFILCGTHLSVVKLHPNDKGKIDKLVASLRSIRWTNPELIGKIRFPDSKSTRSYFPCPRGQRLEKMLEIVRVRGLVHPRSYRVDQEV
jgi:hypothetical protein